MGVIETSLEPRHNNAVAKQMHVSVERYFETSLLLMLLTAFVTLATTGKLDLISVVLVASALVLKLYGHVRDRSYTLSPRTVTRLAVFYIFFYALDFLIFAPGPGITDQMLTATVHLVLFATVIKVFSAQTYRDYGYLTALSFLMMLASAILTVGTAYLVCFAFYVLFAISTFIGYEIKRSTEAAARAPEGPFRQAARNRRALEKALTLATAGLALGLLLFATVLFFVIPRYRTGYLTGLGMQAQNITGFTESVNLGDIRKILRSNVVVMRVRVEGSPRDFQGVKWRGVGLSSFDGRHWYNDNTEQTAVTASSFQRFVLPPSEGWQRRPQRPLRYRVLLSPVSTDVLFVAAVPRELSAKIRALTLDQTGSVRNPQHSHTAFGYDVLSNVAEPSPSDLRRAGVDYPAAIRLVYCHLPQMDPRVQQLARQVSQAATNNYDRALAVQDYLRHNFTYTLDPTGIDSRDPVGSFLFVSKAGYCEYFAAAMAVMLRTLDIPSRLVNGFQTGTYNRVGKDFVVRARDAHSWVEVYFPHYGWIAFDPTPADPNPITAGEWGFLEDYLDAAGLFWNEWVINYDFAHQVQLAQGVERQSRQFQQDFRRRFRDFQRQSILTAYHIEGWLMAHKLLALLLMLAILGGLIVSEKAGSLAEWRFRWVWRFRPKSKLVNPQDATLSYYQLLKTLGKKGIRKEQAETPSELARRLARSNVGPSVKEFTQLYNALRYGRGSVSLDRLRQLVESIWRVDL